MSIAGLLVILFPCRRGDGHRPVWRTFLQWFGSIGESMFSLFQVMTLESWSMGIARPVMEVHPWAWPFFVLSS